MRLITTVNVGIFIIISMIILAIFLNHSENKKFESFCRIHNFNYYNTIDENVFECYDYNKKTDGSIEQYSKQYLIKDLEAKR